MYLCVEERFAYRRFWPWIFLAFELSSYAVYRYLLISTFLAVWFGGRSFSKGRWWGYNGLSQHNAYTTDH